MKKTDFIQAGRYGIYPLSLVASPDLTPTAKLVAIALLDDLRGDQEWVAPTVSDLMRKSACRRTAILQAIVQLKREGWIEIDSHRGRKTRYRFLRSGTESEPVDLRSAPRSGTESGPLYPRSGTESGPVDLRSAPRSGTESGPLYPRSGTESGPLSKEYIKEHKKETPLVPPRGDFSNFGEPEVNPEENGKAGKNGGGSEEEAIEALVQKLRKNYLSAFGGGKLPDTWANRLRRSLASGRLSEETAAAITVEILKAADRWRKSKSSKSAPVWGLGTVLLYMAEKTTRSVPAGNPIAVDPYPPGKSKQDFDDFIARTDAKRAEESRWLAAFRAADAATQKKYIDRVRRLRNVSARASSERIEAQAAVRFAQDQKAMAELAVERECQNTHKNAQDAPGSTIMAKKVSKDGLSGDRASQGQQNAKSGKQGVYPQKSAFDVPAE